MSKIIYYPHYTPSKFHLRSLLLFYEELSSIVPEVDQISAAKRPHIDEIAQASGTQPIRWIDPHYRLFSWEDDQSSYRSLMRLSKKEFQKNWTPTLSKKYDLAILESAAIHLMI